MTARRGTDLGPLRATPEGLRLITEAAEELEERLNAMSAHGLLGDSTSLSARVRAASRRMALQAGLRGRPASKEAKTAFVLALAAGLSVQAAAALAQVEERLLRTERRRDPDFATAWEDALEAKSEPVEERLYDIALSGKADAPATISAAKAVLAANNVRHRPHSEVTRVRGEDGETRRIEWVDDGLTPR